MKLFGPRSATWVMAVALVACGEGKDGDTTRSAETTTVTASMTAPSSYEEVSAEFAVAERQLLLEGSTIVDQLLGNRIPELHQRGSQAFKSEVSSAELEGILARARAIAPIGERVDERALPGGPDNRVYAVDYRHGNSLLRVTVSFNQMGEINSIAVVPGTEPNVGQPDVELELPFDGLWWVYSGGPSGVGNRHNTPDQLFAYDLTVWRAGGTYKNSGKKNSDYWAWGQPVLSPVSGTVITVKDGVRDNEPQVQIENKKEPAGNYVVIEAAPNVFVVMAHFQQNSIRVKEGDKIQPGQVMGLCGNSGNSSEPHIHLHVQNQAELFGDAKAIPIAFKSHLANGVARNLGIPVANEFVSKP